MKKEFINTLIKLAQKDKNIWLLTGDLGFDFFEEFAKKFPERFVNCGVAEQNMIGIAAGLAMEGKKPYVYSIIPFAIMRSFEQIRNDICLQNLNVKIIGAGGGFSYGALGATHHAVEDVAILKALPNISIFCPADGLEMENLLLQSYKLKTPAYIRLDKKAGQIHNANIKIEISKPTIAVNGKSICLIASGPCLATAIQVAQKLRKLGHNPKVISCHTIKPLNRNSWIKELADMKLIFTIEEHRLTGGLGETMALFLQENNFNARLKAFGVPNIYFSSYGSQNYLKKQAGIDEKNIVRKIISIVLK